MGKLAPPGNPKTISTPSFSKEAINAFAPIISTIIFSPFSYNISWIKLNLKYYHYSGDPKIVLNVFRFQLYKYKKILYLYSYSQIYQNNSVLQICLKYSGFSNF